MFMELDSDDETENRAQKIYKRRKIGDDNNFRQLYRFSRENVNYLADYFLPQYMETRGGALSNVEKMRTFLRYVGDPGFQVGVGEDIGIHQTTVSQTVWEVCCRIVSKNNDWIKFPKDLPEIGEAKQLWQRKYTFPNVIGILDCTHIQIKKPPGAHGDEFVNRKNDTSLNCQATCDANEMFTSFNCCWPGSVHDSRIWRNSDIYNIIINNPANAILLADEGYGLTPWVMTPYSNASSSIERNYNRIHKKERSLIERTFGQVKQRFPILQSKIRVALERVPNMIAACFILHNVAKFIGDLDFTFIDIPNENDITEIVRSLNSSEFLRGRARRDSIALFLSNRV